MRLAGAGRLQFAVASVGVSSPDGGTNADDAGVGRDAPGTGVAVTASDASERQVLGAGLPRAVTVPAPTGASVGRWAQRNRGSARTHRRKLAGVARRPSNST